jgi:hypothetical protein
MLGSFNERAHREEHVERPDPDSTDLLHCQSFVTDFVGSPNVASTVCTSLLCDSVQEDRGSCFGDRKEMYGLDERAEAGIIRYRKDEIHLSAL